MEIILSIITFVLGILSTRHFWGYDAPIGITEEEMLDYVGPGMLTNALGISSIDIKLVVYVVLAVALFIYANKKSNGKSIFGKIRLIGVIVCIINLILSFTVIGMISPYLGTAQREFSAEEKVKKKERNFLREREEAFSKPKRGSEYTVSDFDYEEFLNENKYPNVSINATLDNVGKFEWPEGYSIAMWLVMDDGTCGTFPHVKWYYLDRTVKPGESINMKFDFHNVSDLEKYKPANLEVKFIQIEPKSSESSSETE